MNVCRNRRHQQMKGLTGQSYTNKRTLEKGAPAPIFKEAQAQATSIFAIIVLFLFQTTEKQAH